MKKKLKNKKLIVILIIIIVLLITIGLITFICINYNKKNNSNPKDNNVNYEEKIEEEKNEYKVNFDSNGGSKIESQIVKKNENVTKPANPTREGYTFVEWTLNDEPYDFESEVTDNIILKAIWNKEETTTTKSKSSSSGSNTNNNSSSNNSSATSSTIDKINLNDYITVTINYVKYTQPEAYYFINNFSSVFPSLSGKSTITVGFDDANPADEQFDIKYTEWESGLAKANYNVEKYNKYKTLFDNIKNKGYKGINFSYDAYEEKYHLIYKYTYLTVEGTNNKTLNNSLTNIRNNLNSELSGLSKDAVHAILPGYGVYGSYKKLLNEDICKEYHLTCERW